MALTDLVKEGLVQSLVSHLSDVVDAHIKLVSLVDEGVAAASCLVVLLQHQNSLPRLRHDRRCCETSNAGPDEDCVKIGWDLLL